VARIRKKHSAAFKAQVAPSCAGASDPEDRVDEEAVVLGGGSGRFSPAGEEMFDTNLLFIRHLETASHEQPPRLDCPPLLPGFPGSGKMIVNTA
jgi:hypothetical protein